jgi:hypothetical protein
MTPSVGRIVHFEVDEYNAKDINARAEVEGGNMVQAGDLLPAVIVRVWGPTCCNLKIFRDGPQDVWITSVSQGTGPRSFREPARV